MGPHGGWVLCDFGSASSRHGVLDSARDIALEEEVGLRVPWGCCWQAGALFWARCWQAAELLVALLP